ncbi:MAG: translocation/assembly module TamB domain-containing protein [Wenzhouxiangellaceae bacterium]|nr:translocation/assembly module TamB domain-containing protein [Wenzhouxiangellaceae bacterium]
MKRLLLYLAAALAALLVLAAAGWWWLTGTQAGARWLLGQTSARLERFDYARSDGSLAGGLLLNDVVFVQAGLEIEIQRLELAVDFDFVPLGVTVERLRLDGVNASLPEAEPEPARTEPFELGDFSAPIDIRVAELRVTDLVVETAPAAEPVEIGRIEFAGAWTANLEIERLSLEMAPWTLGGRGEVGLTGAWPVDLALELVWRLDETTSQAVSLEFDGRVAALDAELSASGPLAADGTLALAGLPDPVALEAQLSLDGSLAGWPGLEGTIPRFALNGSGGLDDWQAELKGRVEWPELPPADLDLAAHGSSARIELSRCVISTLAGRVRLAGHANLDDPVTARASLELEGLDFTALYPEWPEQARVSGGLNATFDGSRLEVREIALRAPPASLQLGGRAALDTVSGQLDATLEWSALTWPPVLDEAEPLFSSESGRFQASGTLEEWQAELEAWLSLPPLSQQKAPRARVELQADGDAQSAWLRHGRIRIDGAGRVALTGNVRYGEAPGAELELVLEAFDPGAFVEPLPGEIDGAIRLELLRFDPLAATVAIERLDGVLRGAELTGSGALAIADQAVERADLRLSLGDNRVQVDSGSGREWRLRVEANRLAQLWPELAGSVELDADVQLFETRAQWTLRASEVAWMDLRAAELTSEGRAQWGEAPSVDARIDGTDIDLNPWERLDQLEVKLAGNCDAHEFTTYFSGTRATLEFGASGALPGCLEAPADWTGRIDRLAISETPVGAWQLAGPLPVEVRGGRLRAGPGCLWTVASDGRLCLNSLEAGETGRVEIALNSVPMDLLLLPADPVFTVGSNLKGDARVSWGAAGIRSVDGALVVGPGGLRMLEGDEDLLRIRGARLDLTSPRDGALDAALVLRLEEESELTARAEIPDLNAPGAMQLDARADLNLPNLGAFNRLVPQLDRLGGRLEAEFRFSGPLSSPDFDGRVAIRDGELFYAPLGSRVERLDVTLTADEGGGRIEGDLLAGDGRGDISGRLDLGGAAGWRGRLAVSGSKMQVADIDWLRLTVSPDLELEVRPERVDLNGKLHVDRARLGMPPGAEQRVPVSSDVVVVGGQRERDESEEELPARDIAGRVEITLSDNVRLAAAGLETHLAGGLDIEWTPGEPLPNGRGVIRLVKGSYQAYGQNLEVTEGEVLFTAHPIDNPRLDIEAVREIFGDPQVEQAGVRIRGPAQNPNITLFTSPPTTREKALAYVLTGANFDHATGQGAFNVGFWVLPNVFVSYGLGLFDTGNVLAARWELSRRWGLRATSGERDTGADVSFIIDR